MTAESVPSAGPNLPGATKLRRARTLVAAYLVLSLLTVAALAVLSVAAPSQVNAHAWVRGVIIGGTSILAFVFARRAADGSARALLRLRIVVPVLLVAVVVVLLVLSLPTWMVVEQAICGVLLAATTILIF